MKDVKEYLVKSVVPKLGINYPPGVICDSLGGNAEPKPYCCSVLRAITAIEIFDKKCKKNFIEGNKDMAATLIWVTVQKSLGTTELNGHTGTIFVNVLYSTK